MSYFDRDSAFRDDERTSRSSVQVDMDLPQIAVVGQQSAGTCPHSRYIARAASHIAGPFDAGKSSLIESISGITLPRASGTCTRCVVELPILGLTRLTHQYFNALDALLSVS